jgi:ferrochelatase
MRYGEPSIQNSIRTLYEAGADHIVIVPLYPQFADSTVTTSVAAARKAIGNSSPSSVVAPFYAEDQHINALRESIREHLPARYDHVLFSYHGLPERHITQSDPTGKHCLQSVDCCVTESSAHATCYRHQALTTASLVAGGLELSPDQYSISFQSRLGRLPWLTPYTDQVLRELPERGIKHLVVACPAFIADNLETVEEIGIQGRATFLEAGGETLTLIPCLNDHPLWVQGLTQILRDHTTAARADASA